MRFVLGQTQPDQIVKYFQVSGRVKRAVEMDLEKCKADSPGIFLVKSATNGERYVTDLWAGTCTCPDWTYRASVADIPCKHLILARIKNASLPLPQTQ